MVCEKGKSKQEKESTVVQALPRFKILSCWSALAVDAQWILQPADNPFPTYNFPLLKFLKKIVFLFPIATLQQGTLRYTLFIYI
tara:strand:- start:311 stop:562 length:252 start_codon:yes stop_codon:yes gene_type:complete